MSTDDAPTDLTDLMTILSLNTAEQLANLPKQDLDKIIAYQRKQRAMREGGGKTKKESGAPAVDIKALLGKVQPTTKPVEAKPAPSGNGGFVRRF